MSATGRPRAAAGRGPRPRRRWSVALGVVAALVALPLVVGAVPADDDPAVSAPVLLDAVRASGAVPHAGTAESRGRLDLPDVDRLGDLVALLGGTTRTRIWWTSPERWRVDEQRAAGDLATYRDPEGTWSWDSLREVAVRVQGRAAVRLPRAGDLGPAELGRRLAGAATADAVERIGARRVVGRSALGLAIRSDDPRSLVDRVEIWADAATGLPLRVDVRPRAGDEATASAWWLDLDLRAPAADVVAFRVPDRAEVVRSRAPDVVTLVDRFAPFALPERLAGLPWDAPVDALGREGGVGAYGSGWSRVVVLPLPRDIARETFRALDGAPAVRDGASARADVRVLETPLLSAVVARADRRAYLLAGSVRPELLETAADELVAEPPPLREDVR